MAAGRVAKIGNNSIQEIVGIWHQLCAWAKDPLAAPINTSRVIHFGPRRFSLKKGSADLWKWQKKKYVKSVLLRSRADQTPHLSLRNPPLPHNLKSDIEWCPKKICAWHFLSVCTQTRKNNNARCECNYNAKCASLVFNLSWPFPTQSQTFYVKTLKIKRP